MTQRGITVTADDLSRIYGNANPALTYQIGGLGLVNGEPLSGSLATLADQTSNVGSYAITQGTLAASSNYALSFTGGTLTIVGVSVSETVIANPGRFAHLSHRLDRRMWLLRYESCANEHLWPDTNRDSFRELHQAN